MPELPEVETTIRDIRKKIINRKISFVWSDIPQKTAVFSKDGSKALNFQLLKKTIEGERIEAVQRRGKNILILLSGNLVLLIHQKISGHLLFGEWKLENRRWISSQKNMIERVNSYIHFLIKLDNGGMVALSDPRKFAKIELHQSKESLFFKLEEELGPEPLSKNFNFSKFEKAINGSRMAIKKILMDQRRIVGIGNIYADEILWDAKINPFKEARSLTKKNLSDIFKSIGKILNKAIKLKGDSFSDYRLISGEKGGYQKEQKVYQREYGIGYGWRLL